MRFFSRVLMVLVVAFAGLAGLSMPASATSPRDAEPSVARLYQSYFARQPDAAGLRFWVPEFVGGRSLLSIAEQSGDSPSSMPPTGICRICAASVGDPNYFSPRLDRLGELFCADLVNGVYVQRPPTAEESALYPN